MPKITRCIKLKGCWRLHLRLLGDVRIKLIKLTIIIIIIIIIFIINNFLITEKLVCDPPCGENRVCQNYSSVPECICADGYAGEDICTGTNVATNRSILILKCLAVLRDFVPSSKKLVNWEVKHYAGKQL